MNRISVKLFTLLISLLFVLSGCGTQMHEQTVTVETPPPVSDNTSAEDDGNEIMPQEENEPGKTDEKKELTDYELAFELIGAEVEELYAAIGYPEYSDYAPSCLGDEGSEDGELNYDGFTVYTLVEDGVEVVQDVIKD